MMSKAIYFIIAVLFVAPIIPAFLADSAESSRDVFLSLGLLAISLLLIWAFYETILKPQS